MYRRVLSAWVADALVLRRARLDIPCARPGPSGNAPAQRLCPIYPAEYFRRAA